MVITWWPFTADGHPRGAKISLVRGRESATWCPLFCHEVAVEYSMLFGVLLCNRVLRRSRVGRRNPFSRSRRTPGAVVLARDGVAAPICGFGQDWPGVLRAAGDLQRIWSAVTGLRPVLATDLPKPTANVIIVGQIGRSPLITALIGGRKAKRGNPSAGMERLCFRWSMARSGHCARPGIAGSDKRATIYGIYELSQQIGVSPWYCGRTFRPMQRCTLGEAGRS